MKKYMPIILAFLIGAIIASSITVYAALTAREIPYTENKSVADALNELYSKKECIIFDNTLLQSGTKVGNVEITTGNVNSTPGLSITGNTEGRGATKTDNRWEKDIDLTNISALTFYAKKGANHGGVYINVDNDKLPEISYHELTEDWIGYFIDLSQYQGMHKLVIGGGYIDDTGSTTSNTKYCDIRLYGK
ncbi:MAG: hypothetical protein J6M60_00930 [Clostridia bacterium]|nr:hypothetical protein [Clostridia bacterium]